MILVELPEPWTAAQATERIRAIASHEQFSLSYKGHATHQLSMRNLVMGDLIYLLKNGFVYDQPEEAISKPFVEIQNAMYDAKL